MEIGFKYVGTKEGVNYRVSGSLPIELLLEGEVENQRTLIVHIRSLDYLLRGVTNFASGKILGTSIGINHLGKIDKNYSVLNWGLKVPKTDVVTYQVSCDNIKESMYYADAILSDGVNVTPLENKGLLKVSSEQLRSNLVKGVVALGDSKLPYYYSYENESLVLKEKSNDNVIDIEDVVEDDVYIALKLLSLFMYKSKHLGVVFLDCRGISADVIEFIDTMCSMYQKEYGVKLLFLYNSKSNIETDKIYLPNIEK